MLDGVPNSLLLEHHDGGLSVLVSAAAIPKRVAIVAGSEAQNAEGARLLQAFPSELDLFCGDAKWLANLGTGRHFLFPVRLGRPRPAMHLVRRAAIRAARAALAQLPFQIW